MIKKEMYICEFCQHAYEREKGALDCEANHRREKLANKMLKDGKTLEEINICCGFKWELREDLKSTTKDNCFIVSYWQCCKKPAYRITHINGFGGVNLYGKGGFDSCGGTFLCPNRLPTPHPKEELYIR